MSEIMPGRIAALHALVRQFPEEYETCQTCIDYATGRTQTLPPVMAAQSIVSGETPDQIIDRYMSQVHERHLAGLSLGPDA